MKRFSILSLFLIFVIAACSAAAEPGAAGLEATEPPATDEAVIPDTGASPTPQIVHVTVPGDLPGDRVNHAGDQDSSVMADKKRAPSGDRFTFSKFERPFNADTMDVYFADIDLQDFTVYLDETFVYSSVLVKSMESGSSPKTASYAVEFDLDLDGFGDVLVLIQPPTSTDWTTDSVQVWFDANGDVGGEKFLETDENTGDGYETMIFDQGQGNDPDTAWVRLSPEDPNGLDIAVKLSLFDGDTKFLMGFWAGNENLNPASFDFNDYFTHEQAGAANPDFEIYYPIKALAELDNSCRLNVGFAPNGNEPGLCPIPGVTPGEADASACSISCGQCESVNPQTCSCVPVAGCSND